MDKAGCTILEYYKVIFFIFNKQNFDNSKIKNVPPLPGGDAGDSEGAGALQAEEEGGARPDVQGEPEVLRDVFVLPDRHHWLLRPHVPRPVHRGPRPRHPHSRFRGEARGVPRHPEQSHPR